MTDFALYLRPFETDAGLQYARPSAWRHLGLLSLGEYTQPKEDYLERQFNRALKDILSVVAIGGEPAVTGAGRIRANESEWQDTFKSLSQNATCIYVIPLDNQWTLWEILELKKRKLLHKTLFLMPPKPKHFDLAKRWNASQVTFEAEGLHFPRYNPEGAILRIGRDGTIDLSTTATAFYRANAIRELAKSGYDLLMKAIQNTAP